MKSVRRRVLGFDARLNEEDNRRLLWDAQMRELFLLRPEIEDPLSVDSHIWPTHFLYHPQIRHLIPPRIPALIEVDRGCGGGLLWLDLARMKQRLSEHRRPAVPIAVEMLTQQDLTIRDFPSPLLHSRPEPDAVPPGSELLGYDVADSGFCSGLSNCGYGKEEIEALRPEWAERINDCGLLRNEEDAFAFAELSNVRVREHAPFWVFGLYRVGEGSEP